MSDVYPSVSDALSAGKDYVLSYSNASLWFKFNGVLMQEPVTVFQKMQGFFEGRTTSTLCWYEFIGVSGFISPIQWIKVSSKSKTTAAFFPGVSSFKFSLREYSATLNAW